MIVMRTGRKSRNYFSGWRSLLKFAFVFLFFGTLCGFKTGGDPAPVDRFRTIEQKLKDLSATVPGLNNKVDLSLNGVAIQEFVRGLATGNNLNVSVEPSLDTKLFDNFSDVTVIDVFVFLCKRYDLDMTFVGNIMVFSKYTPPPPVAVPYSPRLPDITWDASASHVTLDLKNDSIALVARELTRKTGKNVVFAPDLIGKTVNGYIQDEPLKDALDKMAFANDLKITPTEDNFFLIERNDKNAAGKNYTASAEKKNAGLPAGTAINTDNGLITLQATNAPISDLVYAISSALKVQYFLFSDLKGTATLNIQNASYDDFLQDVFNGTEFTYRKNSDVYYIGDRSQEGLRLTKVVQLKYRTVDKIADYIPADIKKDVDVKVFPDLNSIILCGSEPAINEIESFLRQIDQVVPMVLIEVVILDVNNSHTVTTGIQAGIGTPPANNGTVLPGVDVTVSADAINNLISGLNGFGILNLGFIRPDFYLRLQALETQGFVKIRSTPKLATLNGSQATMSIGSTQYYKEQATNIIGAQNPQTQITTVYKPVNADFSLNITPMVSGDEQITLNITVKQSSFTGRFDPNGPPGTTQRDFQSVVRVKNEEMILLGGLEEENTNDSGQGTPVLSRIPIIKWLFSSRTKSKTKTKLSVLIRPTVIY